MYFGDKSFIKLVHNVWRLGEGGAFTHYRSIGVPHFNCTKKLSTEALHPRFCQTAVIGWRSWLSWVTTIYNVVRLCHLLIACVSGVLFF